MKKSITYYMIIIFFSLSFSLFAQEDDPEINEEWIELDRLGIINEDGTVSTTNNYGDRFRMQVRERDEKSHTEPGNRVYIEQYGEGNSTVWTQEGNNNTFNLKQNGDKNIHEGSLIGEENLIRVLQQGNNNTLFQDLAGDRMDLEVIQEGNNHELIQVEHIGDSPAYQIHQQGNHGMKVKIEHERY